MVVLKRLLFPALCLLAVTAIADPQSRPDAAYLQSLAAFRDFADYRFRDRVLSPLPEAQRLTFSGLRYFEPDPALALPASFIPARDTATFAMPTFDHRTLSYSHFGTLEARLEDRLIRLQAFRREGGSGLRDVLLIPFRDTTNGHETYPGGRYIEIDLPLPDTPLLDFNRAANPLCAYDASYACPIPPAANHLPIAIRAGEKAYR